MASATASLSDEETWEGLEVDGNLAGVTASHVDIIGCRLSRIALTGADIDRLRLIDTVLDDCDLSGATLSRTSFTRVAFHRCRLSGIAVPGAQLTDVRFEDCKLDAANLRLTTWQRCLVDGCLTTASDFSEAQLGGTRFECCDLTGAEFTKATMAGVHLAGSTLDDIRGGDSLRGVVITSEQVIPLAMAIFSELGIRIDDARENSAGP